MLGNGNRIASRRDRNIRDAHMHVGIDASNLRLGGGVTHLSRMLTVAQPETVGIDKVTVWACKAMAATLPDHPWLKVCHAPWVESGLVTRMFSQQFKLPSELKSHGCDILFSPGGTLPRRLTIPSVTMSQNMLPFEPVEAARFGVFSAMWLKMKLLRISQGRSFRQADGLIFLTRYARDSVGRSLGNFPEQVALIPHGIEPRFSSAPKRQRALSECTLDRPFRLLYVSIAMPYKHQIAVARAVSTLRGQGVPLEINFIGPSWGRYGRMLRSELDRMDKESKFMHWAGAMPFEQLHEEYLSADAFVFASSCENLPNIMIEAMAAGLPIASSNRGPMPEVLGNAGLYFNPDSVDSIAQALEALMEDAPLRATLAESAWKKALEYSWERCAQDTFAFIVDTANKVQCRNNSKFL